MFENLVFPIINAIGVYDSAFSLRGIKETAYRDVNCFEIDFAVENGGYAYLDGEKIPLLQNTVLCAKPGSKRRTVTPYRCLYLHLSLTHGALYDCFSRCPNAFLPREAGEFEHVFHNLVDAYNISGEKDELYIAENLLAVCRLIDRETEGIARRESLQRRVPRPEIIENAVKFLSEHYAERLTLADIAARSYLTPTYFHKMFVQAIGKTPVAYLENLRIQRAKELLIKTDRSLANIAIECGFSSQAYFCAVFRRACGMTPGNYRRGKNSEYWL